MVIKVTKQTGNQSLLLLLVITVSISSIEVSAADQWQGNGNGTVTDLATGLIWQQQGDNVSRPHASALTYCAELSLGSSSNWHLPKVKELSSIVDERVRNPSIDDAAFPNTISNNYWSASNLAVNSGSAWGVSFFGGDVNMSAKTNKFFVRCVR